MYLDASLYLKLFGKCPAFPYSHRETFYKLIWPKVSAGTLQPGWTGLGTSSHLNVQQPDNEALLLRKKTLWSLAEQELHSRVFVLTVSLRKLKKWPWEVPHCCHWEQWELNDTTDTTEVLQVTRSLCPSLAGCWGSVLHRTGSITCEETWSNLVWVLPLVCAMHSGRSLGAGTTVMIFGSLMQGWAFVKGLWGSGTWTQWQLRGIWCITQLKSPGNVSKAAPLFVPSRKETNMGTEVQHAGRGSGASVLLATCGLWNFLSPAFLSRSLMLKNLIFKRGNSVLLQIFLYFCFLCPVLGSVGQCTGLLVLPGCVSWWRLNLKIVLHKLLQLLNSIRENFHGLISHGPAQCPED